MKTVLKMTLLSLALAMPLFANASQVQVAVLCQQGEGDRWIEVGVGLNDGPGYRMYVVQHDDDRTTLAGSYNVAAKTHNGSLVYTNSSGTVRLSIAGNQGSFSQLADGPGSKTYSGLQCYSNRVLKF